MVYVQWGGLWEEWVLFLIKKGMFWSIWFALCSEETNVESLHFDMCEQLVLSVCKMHLIIVYSETKVTMFYIWTRLPLPWTTNQLETLRTIPVMTYTGLKGLCSSREKKIDFKMHTDMISILPIPSICTFSSQTVRCRDELCCVSQTFPRAVKSALVWDHSI